MTIEECYSSFGGDYAGVMSRLMKEDRVLKYTSRFCAGNDYEQIVGAIEVEKWEEAFRLVHNLKGVSLNLGLTPLGDASHILCEALRHGKPAEDPSGMLQDVKTAYDTVISALKQLF